MMKLSQFFEDVYVCTYLDDARPRTIEAYRESVKHAVNAFGDPNIDDLLDRGSEFKNYLRSQFLAPATIAKHCGHLNSIFRKIGPKGYRNHDAKGLLAEAPYFQAPNVILNDPKEVSDEQFIAIFNAFADEKKYPQYLSADLRPVFWQTILILVSKTAIRRQAIVGIEWQNLIINSKDINKSYIVIEPENDKKKKTRYKAIDKNVVVWLEKIRPENWKPTDKIFQWDYEKTLWYKCWNCAEKRAGVKIGLHDIKRYSGSLAIRAGADILTLQQHMDHANIATTIKHYCRPKTGDLVTKINTPIPCDLPTPPPTRPLTFLPTKLRLFNPDMQVM